MVLLKVMQQFDQELLGLAETNQEITDKRTLIS